jgi:uncharacterized membrane protein YtjA (UPF0391 family)
VTTAIHELPTTSISSSCQIKVGKPAHRGGLVPLRRSRMTGWGNIPTFPMLNWAITFLLLSLVLIFFTMVGTAGEFASLLARVASASFLVLAVTMFLVYVKHRGRHPGAS